MKEKKEAENLPRLKEPEKEFRRISRFVKEKVRKTKGNTAVIGLSGGIDSAVVTRIAEKTPGLVATPVFMPGNSTPDRDYKDVERLYEGEKSGPKRLDINQTVEDIKSTLPEMDQLSLANVKARVRMTYLYGISNIQDGLVLGTSNLSEWMLGYFTKYGDGASDISPIRHLYKTEVKDLARWLDIPESIIDKPPSAGLWYGQTDQKELGGTYRDIDRIIHYHLELELSEAELKEKCPSKEDLIETVLNKISSQDHKRKKPPALPRS